MFEGLIGLLAIIALFVIVSRQQSRIGLIERELGALRGLVLSGIHVPATASALAGQVAADQGADTTLAPAGEAGSPGAAAAIEIPLAVTSPLGPEPAADDVQQAARPGSPSGADETAPFASAAAPNDAVAAQNDAKAPWHGTKMPLGPAKAAPRPDIETALGTRWAVWVGGIALALGGIFLIRYTIEAGIFGPEVRLLMAAALGLVLVAGGEFVRRTGFKVPVQGVAGAYIPAILTGAGAFILFGAVYAAHGVYGFIGPAFAFALLGAIGVATITAALVHGQALAGIGLLGSFVTPVLVSSQSPNPLALFGYLAVVLAVTGAIARTRLWTFLMAAGFVGTGIWTILYMTTAPGPDIPIVLFIDGVTLAVLAFVWLAARRDDTGTGFDWPSIAPAFFLALSALGLFVDNAYAASGGRLPAAGVLAALVAVAAYRPRALPLLHAAGVVTVLIYLGIIPSTSLSPEFSNDTIGINGLPAVAADSLTLRIGVGLALVFLVVGFWSARRFAASSWVRAASCSAWAAAAPLLILLALWITFGDLDRDFAYASAAALLLVAFSAGAEWISRAEEPPLQGGAAVSFALAGAGIAALLMLHMAFGSGMTTVLLGLSAIVPALATRLRSWPMLGWLSLGAAVAVLGRVAFDPTIVGAASLSTTPVFNWLLPGYGIPALGFAFAAWQLARTTNGRPRLAMEAAAALFSILTVAMLVRHAMHGGVVDTGALTLAEQAIYTLIAIGAGAILISIDTRSPSSVLRYGSMAIGILSVAFVAIQHFVVLDPLFTDESTGQIPVFNLLFLAYLLPAVAAGGLALYARDKRPKWYAAMLALVASLLAFAYASLSVRRLFKGEFIGAWSGLGQVENYTYSALWLVMGVALLTAGVWLKSQVLRIASAALISIAVLKVFLFDMSELEGVLRALSFIGLGAVLIGIGLFYQRLLTKAAGANGAN